MFATCKVKMTNYFVHEKSRIGITHMGDGGSVADFFSAPRLTGSPGTVKKSATERPIPHVCKSKNRGYIEKHQFIFL